jgi:RNA polymerase sigma factor (sigma-70 family)
MKYLERYIEKADKEKVKALVEENKGLVYHNFNKKHHNFTRETYKTTGVWDDDLLAEGFVGLLVAATTFDETKKVPFGAHASRIINQYMIRFRTYLNRQCRKSTSNVSLDVTRSVDNETEDMHNCFGEEDAGMEAFEASDEWNAILHKTPKKMQKILRDYYVNGLIWKEIAEKYKLGTSQNAHNIHVRYLQSMKKFRHVNRIANERGYNT